MQYRQKYPWGPPLWEFIHTISIIDFENSKPYNNSVHDYLMNLENSIPCYKCKALYQEFLSKLSYLDLSKPMVIFYWSVDLHNAVNKKLNKPEWTYEQALEKWCRGTDGSPCDPLP